MATNRENIKNDLFDTFLSVRFELVKHLKHRRLLIVAALAIIVPLLFYIKTPDTAGEFAANILSFVNLLIVISAAMFAGDAVCGEFEKKTSLLLFSTPQSRPAIFAGKYIAALMSTFLVVVLYYLTMTLQIGQHYGWGEIPTELGKSFLTALIYSASAVSVVFLFSSHSEALHACHDCWLPVSHNDTADCVYDLDGYEPRALVHRYLLSRSDHRCVRCLKQLRQGRGGGEHFATTQYTPAFGGGDRGDGGLCHHSLCDRHGAGKEEECGVTDVSSAQTVDTP